MFFFLFALFAFTCGNPELNYYLLHKDTEGSARKKEELLLLKNPHIYLESPMPYELDLLGDQLGLASEEKYYRLPPLQIFRFRLENRSNEKKSVYFYDCLFKEKNGENYPVVESTIYTKRFTSSAYGKFPYNSIYAFYFTKHPEKKKREFGPYFDRVLPGEEVELVPESGGFQLVPFELLPARDTELELFCEKMGLRVNFLYRTERSDKPKYQ
ncbi:MAG: hypothetical protein NZM25_02175 [Leptospiraceae bacterium]|nr:hypothetical protein [Leptospiraceae bacterium]MDW8306984.1 hypothetical protein [Leptospiraceae bacterium]